jgi:rare lipoprotein A
MPLPSYARVTNLKDGSSVVVRVNDRGPYADGRIIDLSKRAAEMLDYSTAGVAHVKVQYIGPAPLVPNDDRYLMASYRPGKDGAPLPGEGGATGSMIAMNGSTPVSGHGAVPFPGELTDGAAPAPSQRPAVELASARATDIVEEGDPVLPAFGPIVPERPSFGVASSGVGTLPVLGYADMRVESAAKPFQALLAPQAGMTPADIVASWKRTQPAATGKGDEAAYVAVGTFASASESSRQAKSLSAYGRVEIETAEDGGHSFYSVNLYPDGRASVDDMLRHAWAAGATQAMTVRD